jgi:hypothetical protein
VWWGISRLPILPAYSCDVNAVRPEQLKPWMAVS